MSRITVKFIASKSPYMVGEVAGFPRAQAENLINAGYAIAVESTRAQDAARLKNITAPPETKHVPGPARTKATGTKPRGSKK